MTLTQIIFHFHLAYAEKMWWTPTTLTVGSLHCLIKFTVILSALLLLLHHEHSRLKWANVYYLPVSIGQELKSGFTGWFRLRTFHDIAGKLPARAAGSWELDCDWRMCPQAHRYGYWHISEYQLASSLTLLQAEPSSMQYGPLQRLSSLTTWFSFFQGFLVTWKLTSTKENV